MKIKRIYPTAAQRKILNHLLEGGELIVVEDMYYLDPSTEQKVDTALVQSLWHSGWLIKDGTRRVLSPEGRDMMENRNHKVKGAKYVRSKSATG